MPPSPGAPGRCHGRRGSRGQSLTEFALALPVLLLVLLIALDFGRVFLGWVNLTNAARVAANYASTNPQPWTSAQQARYTSLIQSETAGINCTLPNPLPNPTYPDGSALGGRAEVNLSCTFPLITPFLENLLSVSGIAVGSTADFAIRTGTIANLPPGPGGTPTPPQALFSANPQSGIAPLTVNFTDLSTGGPQTWLWDFGDGTQDNNQNPPAHTYATTGTYTVTLTVTNGAGSSQSQQTIAVSAPGPAPAAGFYGTVPAPCVTSGAPSSEQCGGPTGTPIFYTWSMTVNFSDTSQNTSGATYLWTFGDGGTSTASNPSHTYSTPGSFNVTLTLTSSNGTSTTSRNAYVNSGCIIPSFTGVSSTSAASIWVNAHFLAGNIFYYQPGAPNKNAAYKTNPVPSYIIQLQNPQGSAFYPAVNNKGTWQCNNTINVAPLGASWPP